jgi:hypothetical protein
VIVGVALGWVGTWWQSRLNWKQTRPRNSTPVAAELLATWNLARIQILRPAGPQSRSAKVSRPNVYSSSPGGSDRSTRPRQGC